MAIDVMKLKFVFVLIYRTTNNEREKLIYYPTHARMVSWLTGVILAFVYSIYSKKQERIKISSILRLIGYAFCMVVFGAIVVNTYFASSETSSIPIAVFNSFSRFLWSLGIAFIIFTSITNNGGSVNTFLSSPMWKPLSRLSFCIYVLHYVIQLMKIGQNRTTMYVDNFSLVRTICVTMKNGFDDLPFICFIGGRLLE